MVSGRTLGYLLKRLGFGVFIVWAVTFLVFALMRLAPGSPADVLLSGGVVTEEMRRTVIRQYHPNDPWYVQYSLWLRDVLAGDLGYPFSQERPVATLIADRWAITAQIVSLSMVLATLMSIPTGIVAGYKHGSRLDELLDRVGVSPADKHRRQAAFSGGQKQRIAIARALAVEPSLLVADEPVSRLDVSVQAQIFNRLMDLQEEFGLGLVCVTHNLGIARKISDTIGVMYLGNIVEYGDVDDIFENPQHPYTRALLSANPVPDPTVDRDRVVLEGSIPDPVTVDDAGCPFASRCPEAIDECESAEMGLALFEGDDTHLVDCIRR